MFQFRVGSPVEFTHQQKGVLRGHVARINQKTITVRTPTGTWRVVPSRLRKTAGSSDDHRRGFLNGLLRAVGL